MDALEATLREKWVAVRGVPTYVLCQGSYKDHSTIIIIVPGLHYTLYLKFLISSISFDGD